MRDSARDTVTILPRARDIYIESVRARRVRGARAKIRTRATKEPEGSTSRRRCVNVNVREGALSMGIHSRVAPRYCSRCAVRARARPGTVRGSERMYTHVPTKTALFERTLTAAPLPIPPLTRALCISTRTARGIRRSSADTYRDFLSFRVFCCFATKRSRPGLRPDLNVAHVASSFSYSPLLLSFLFLSSPLLPPCPSVPDPLLAPPRPPFQSLVLMYLTVATLPHIRYRTAAWWGRMRILKEWEVVHRYLTTAWWGFIW